MHGGLSDSYRTESGETSNPILGSQRNRHLKMARLSKKEKEDRRKAFIFFVLTVAGIIAFLFFGLPTVAKFAAFLTDLRTSTAPVETQDETPPPPPRINTLPSHTNESEIDIKGSTEAGATVFITVNEEEEEILANSEGQFIYGATLSLGENKIQAFAQDNAGNKSKTSEIVSVVYNNEPPELEITRPEDGKEFFGPTQRQIVVEGETEENMRLLVNDRQVVVEQDGSFAYATTLTDGENEFTVKAQDQAGNITEKSFTVTYSP